MKLYDLRGDHMAEAIAILEATLDRARAGEIMSVLMVVETASDELEYVESGYSDRHRLAGGLADLQQRLLLDADGE